MVRTVTADDPPQTSRATPALTTLKVRGFRSLKDVQLTDLRPVTVLIGANGSGKSNILSVLQMVRLLAYEGLQLFVGRQGGAGLLMHYGPKTTRVVEIELEFETIEGTYGYQCDLGHAAHDSLIFLDERVGHRSSKPGGNWSWTSLGAGHRESRLADETAHVTVRAVRRLMRNLNFFHFHDTSSSSALRTNAKSEDDRYLRSDGSNLAAFLLRLKASETAHEGAAFRRISSMVRQVAPFVRHLDPTPLNDKAVRLDWIDDRGDVFGPSHLSDGTLRSIALMTALGQTTDRLPLLTAIDEPELGLHPAAIGVLCEMVKAASQFGQIVLATQAPAVLDHFEPADVVVAERIDFATQLRRLVPEDLSQWLQTYAMSELFDRNVLGAFP